MYIRGYQVSWIEDNKTSKSDSLYKLTKSKVISPLNDRKKCHIPDLVQTISETKLSMKP